MIYSPLVVTRVEAADALDDGDDLVVHERWPAADTVPAQQDLRHHCRVHPVPEQMPRERGNRVVPFTLSNAFPDEPTPVADRMRELARFLDSRPEHPVRQRCQLRIVRRPIRHPRVALARCVERRRRHHISTVAAQIHARPLWTPMHRLPMFRDCPRDDLSVAESVEQRLVNLPSSAALAMD